VFLNANSSGQASAGFRRVQGEGDSVPEEGVILAVWGASQSTVAVVTGIWGSGD
jgi:hypothetical protein